MTARPYVIDQLISAKAIAARVEALAAEISAYFAGTDKLVVVGLLRGSFVFIADLVREIDLPVEVDFLEASSGRSSSRTRSAMKTNEPRRSPTTTSLSVPAKNSEISRASASTRAAIAFAEIISSIT